MGKKVLWQIYGPVCENGEWRIRTNTELYDELDTVTEVKRMRLRWLGHMSGAQGSFIVTNQKV
jgi:hypothetical protein